MRSHLRYWTELCDLAEIDADSCFDCNDGHVSGRRLQAEADILSAFMAFVVSYPCTKNVLNSAAYALQVLWTVHSFYDDKIGRRPGTTFSVAFYWRDA